MSRIEKLTKEVVTKEVVVFSKLIRMKHVVREDGTHAVRAH